VELERVAGLGAVVDADHLEPRAVVSRRGTPGAAEQIE
jgi:hypothetical protein